MKTKIDFEKTNYQMLSATNVEKQVVKGAMFVGANASGKSNTILSMKFLLDVLLGKSDMNMKSYVCLFSKEPNMNLVYTFVIDGVEIKYVIDLHKINNIIKEEVFVAGERVMYRDGKYAVVEINEKSIYEDVPDNSLFLREVYFSTKFRGNIYLQKWYEFLSNSIYVDLYEGTLTNYRDIDLSMKTYMENDGEAKINKFFDEYNFEQKIEYNNDSKGPTITIHSDEKMIYFKRKGIDDPIPFNYESTGNKNLLHLLPAFFACIENGGMLLLDEFSSGFHNDLEELLIRYFMHNATESQIFFVSHSTNLLTNSLLRPDQLYSVTFDSNGSHLKRFSSEKPREAQNLEKMYLSGIFNGVPRYEYKSK